MEGVAENAQTPTRPFDFQHNSGCIEKHVATPENRIISLPYKIQFVQQLKLVNIPTRDFNMHLT